MLLSPLEWFPHRDALQRIVTSKCTSTGMRVAQRRAYFTANSGTCQGENRDERMRYSGTVQCLSRKSI